MQVDHNDVTSYETDSAGGVSVDEARVRSASLDTSTDA